MSLPFSGKGEDFRPDGEFHKARIYGNCNTETHSKDLSEHREPETEEEKAELIAGEKRKQLRIQRQTENY